MFLTSTSPNTLTHRALALAACLLAAPAWAQPELEAYRGMKPSTRPVCEQRCNAGAFPNNPRMNEYQTQLGQIRYQKNLETDADKRKALEQQEQVLVERRERLQGRICKEICQHNPEN